MMMTAFVWTHVFVDVPYLPSTRRFRCMYTFAHVHYCSRLIDIPSYNRSLLQRINVVSQMIL